jgi:hypothetical protein
MKMLTNALIALFFCVSFAHAEDKPMSAKKHPEKRETARDAMLKERTPEQKKFADCSLKANNQELKGKERDKSIEKCMAKQP